jgi:hypothetical protein
MLHILGTDQGQYDIFYGIIWGTAPLRTGIFVVLSTVLIGSSLDHWLRITANGWTVNHAYCGYFYDCALHHDGIEHGGSLNPVIGRSLIPQF